MPINILVLTLSALIASATSSTLPSACPESALCDGRTLDNDCNGWDETSDLCNDPETFYFGRPCVDGDSYRRCRLWRPGQCVPSVNVCDGLYDCADRSDEDGCVDDVREVQIDGEDFEGENMVGLGSMSENHAAFIHIIIYE